MSGEAPCVPHLPEQGLLEDLLACSVPVLLR